MKRYAVTIDNHSGAWRSGVDESATGPWVKYEDAQAEIERLKGDNERLRHRCAALAFLHYGGPSPDVEPPDSSGHPGAGHSK